MARSSALPLFPLIIPVVVVLFRLERRTPTPHQFFYALLDLLTPRARLAVLVFKLMVINGLKSVNDAVSTMYKPAARKLPQTKMIPKRVKPTWLCCPDSRLVTRKND
jgi:hypothetical protein